MRIFLGPGEISGYYTKLKIGLKKLGHEVYFLDLSASPFSYGGGDTDSIIVRLLMACAKKYRQARVSRTFWLAVMGILMVPVFLRMVFRCDVFVFGYARSFFGLYDLKLLKLLKKKIIFVFHGSDCRPPYLNGAVWLSENDNVDNVIKQTHQTRARIAKIEKYADAIITHPFYSHLNQRPAVAWDYVGFPWIMPSDIKETPSDSSITRVLHAPSLPQCKGTPLVRAAIDNLKAKGKKIEYIEIQNRPNAEVMRELARCDFVVNELFGDVHYSALAMEAASLGKPTLIGGYDLEGIARHCPGAILGPVATCIAENVETAMERLISDQEYRETLGKKAKDYAQNHCDLTRFAERFVRVIEATPEEWLFDPTKLRYLWGWGLSRQRVIQYLRSYLTKGGREALRLDANPRLEQLLADLASIEPQEISSSGMEHRLFDAPA